MDIHEELDGFMKESIDYTLGLPVSSPTLAVKLRASEESERRVIDQYLHLLSQLKEKDEIIERSRAESSMNAQALKKFVEENQKFANECTSLVAQRTKLEKEINLFYGDREMLMDFGNEADERARNAETRVCELEEDVKRLSDELQCYKEERARGNVTSSTECSSMEDSILEEFLTTLVGDEVASSARAFLVANSGHDSCQKLLKMWNSLKPSTQKILSLAAEVKTFEKDKELLRMNLHSAEEEVKVLADENALLLKENKRFYKRCLEEICYTGSDVKHSSSASVKRNKRKSSPKTSSPIEKMMDLSDNDSTRYALSPLEKENRSPDPRVHKK